MGLIDYISNEKHSHMEQHEAFIMEQNLKTESKIYREGENIPHSIYVYRRNKHDDKNTFCVTIHVTHVITVTIKF